MARKKNTVSVAPGETKQMVIPNGNSRKTHKILTDEQIEEIRDDFYFGIPARIIGMRQGKSTNIVKECIIRRTFKHHNGPKVASSDFHRQDAANRKAFDKARKMYGDKPTRDQVHGVLRSTYSAELAKKVEQEGVLCHYCSGATGTIPVKVIIEDKPRFTANFCAACYGEFHIVLHKFFVG